MTSKPESRSSLERFFDNFFHEKNIRWMLGIGVMILFGSSVMLVTQHWGDMTPFWKCLVVMGYTGVVYAASDLTYGRLGLRMTGTVLKALTLLLIPVSFMSLNWLSSGSATTVDGSKIGFAALMVLHGIFSTFAARRVLTHFLRSTQPTLLVSYLALCFAGAIAPAIGPHSPMLTSLMLWALFAVGSVKSARHVFWMMEEHKLPRIFGFFPILLLGIQFGLLFGFACAPHLSLDWLGFGCALVAIPILLTADTVTHVYEQRTGGLIRPLPPRIILPLALGTVLCPVAVGLAATTLPNAFALVPTAIVVAIMMAVVARRTHHTGFAWMMVAFVCVAYKFCPVYFQELAAALRDSAAHSLHEDKLPFAFYGLTCLPLLLVSAVLGRWFKRSGETLFARVLPQFAVGGSIFLTAIAVTNLKAAFMVPAVMAGWFVCMAVYFGDRRILIPAMLATIMASWTAIPFGESVLGISCGMDATWISLTTASLLLLAGSRLSDTDWLPLPTSANSMRNGSVVAELMQTGSGKPRPLGKYLSATVSIAASVGWITQNLVQNNASFTGWLLLTTTLVIQTLVCRERKLAGFSIVFGLVAGVLFAKENSYSAVQIANGLNLAAFGLWTIGCWLHHSQNRISNCYARPLQHISTLTLLGFLFLWHGPKLISGSIPSGTLSVLELALAASTIVWSLHSASRMKIPGLAHFATLVTMPLVSAIVLFFVNDRSVVQWYPLCWAITLISSVPVLAIGNRLLKSRPNQQHSFHEFVAAPVQTTAHALLSVLVMLSLPAMSGKLLTGVVALIGVGVLERKRSRATLLPSTFLANWYALAILATNRFSRGWSDGTVVLAETGFILAAAASLSALLFRIPACNHLYGVRKYGTLHRAALHVTTFFSMSLTIAMVGQPLSPAVIGLVVVIFVFVITDLMMSAIALQNRQLVWASLLTAFASVCYLAIFDVIPVHFGMLSYGLLAIASVLYLLSRIAQNSDRLRIICGPFQKVAWVLPSATMPIAIVSALAGKTATWLGGDSQALLFAGAFYFWTGLQTKKRSLLILATGFVNVALVLLWVDLKWSDPQLFMIPIGVSVIGLVQLLKKEIPRSLLNPLRYAGALMILVSPTFHIIGGSWLHMFSLMVVSVLVIFAAIGLRLRALVYTGTAFLAADLAAMVFRGSFDNPNLLWLGGLCLGASVIGMAAVFEGQREKILGRIRLLAATLETWE